MSEYQHYEFMTIDRPLTREQLDAVNTLSSHIEATSTHALIIYHWGDFKHDPIDVLHKYFDGFLYWANWGAPELAFREAVRLLVELREAADQFKQNREFEERFRAWVQPLLRRPALVKRLQARKFTLPEA